MGALAKIIFAREVFLRGVVGESSTIVSDHFLIFTSPKSEQMSSQPLGEHCRSHMPKGESLQPRLHALCPYTTADFFVHRPHYVGELAQEVISTSNSEYSLLFTW